MAEGSAVANMMESVAGLLHLATGLLWLVMAGWLCLARSPRPALLRAQDLAAAGLAASAVPLAGLAGWWVDLFVPAAAAMVGLLALPLAVGALVQSERLAGTVAHVGRMAALALGGLHLALGAAALRNEMPLEPWLAWKSILLGTALLALPWQGLRRLRQALIVALLVSAGLIGAVREVPFA